MVGLFLLTDQSGDGVRVMSVPATTRVFWPNLMFEEELAGHVVSSDARRRAQELAAVVGLLADSSDDIVLVDRDSVPEELPACLSHIRFLTEAGLRGLAERDHQSVARQLIPWGASEAARCLANRHGLMYDGPEASVVEAINSRQFLIPFDRVQPLSCAGPGVADLAGTPWCDRPFSTICRTFESVAEVIAEQCRYAGPQWVIKAEFSQSARNRILGTGLPLTVPHQNWVERQLEQGSVVAVEPWVRRVAECGLQFRIRPDLPREGLTSLPDVGSKGMRVVFDGMAQLINSRSGVWLGSIVRSPAHAVLGDSVWQPAICQGFSLAAAAADLGYHGFLGIDCMIFEQSGGLRFLRLAHDVNGRCTMGRMALSMVGQLADTEVGFWGRISPELIESRQFSLTERWPESVRIVPTSPGLVGGRAVRVSTALLATADRQSFGRVLRQLSDEDHWITELADPSVPP